MARLQIMVELKNGDKITMKNESNYLTRKKALQAIPDLRLLVYRLFKITKSGDTFKSTDPDYDSLISYQDRQFFAEDIKDIKFKALRF